MSQKQFKRLRKQLRSVDVDPAQREYTLTEESQLKMNPFALQISMTTDSGRIAYKQLKRQRKNERG